jgi:hypothetical protein
LQRNYATVKTRIAEGLESFQGWHNLHHKKKCNNREFLLLNDEK